MSKEYDLYLKEHKENVVKGFRWIQKYLPALLAGLVDEDLEWQISIAHDASKTDQEEYDAYDAYFYGGNRSYAVVQDFNLAWLHHIHCNKHHWQHWVLINDDPNEGEIILDMPLNYIIEMICDWWAFSWSRGNLREIFNWYEDHKDYMKLSNKTRYEVTCILDSIKNILDEIGYESMINDAEEN